MRIRINNTAIYKKKKKCKTRNIEHATSKAILFENYCWIILSRTGNCIIN